MHLLGMIFKTNFSGSFGLQLKRGETAWMSAPQSFIVPLVGIPAKDIVCRHAAA